MRPDIAEQTRGRWPGILVAFGISDKVLDGNHHPCPVCQGTDRFRFDDKDGSGSWFCNNCEPRAGSGLNLLMNFTGQSFAEVADRIREKIGSIPQQQAKPKPAVDMGAAIARILGECKPMQPGDEAHRYLRSRGIWKMPAVGLHPGMNYREGEKVLGQFPVMIASARNADGRIMAIHRTYLKDGAKAPVPKAKKSYGPIEGTALRLYPAALVMGVAEGIETACAAAQLFDMPVWAALNRVELERFVPDPMVCELHIFADNDDTYTGQLAAYALAHRLRKATSIKCVVHVPHRAGSDWANHL